jgi:hypothetical protein
MEEQSSYIMVAKKERDKREGGRERERERETERERRGGAWDGATHIQVNYFPSLETPYQTHPV